MYELNGDTSGKYVDGRFYTWFYGIPQFLVESEINCNFRLEGPQPHELFYPKVRDLFGGHKKRTYLSIGTMITR